MLLRTLLAGSGTVTASGDGLAWIVDGPAGVRGGITCGCATVVETTVERALSIWAWETRYYVLYIGRECEARSAVLVLSSREAASVRWRSSKVVKLVRRAWRQSLMSPATRSVDRSR